MNTHDLAFKAANGMLSFDAEGEWRLNQKEVECFAHLVRAQALEEVAGVCEEVCNDPHDLLLATVYAENEALKSAQYECGFGAGCCYQAAKSEADEVLLRQALDTLAYWLEHGETPGSHDMIQRTHDVLQERLK